MHLGELSLGVDLPAPQTTTVGAMERLHQEPHPLRNTPVTAGAEGAERGLHGSIGAPSQGRVASRAETPFSDL